MKRAVFLDLDGTLVDPKPGITGSIQHALTQVGIKPPEADKLAWCIGPPLVESFAKLGVPDPHEALRHYREIYDAGNIFEAAPYPGILTALEGMAANGHRLFLATAKPHIAAKRVTAHFGLDRHLLEQFGPELDGTRNDKGELLRHALDHLGLSPNAAVMVGDRGSDLQAARDSGMPFVGVTWGYHQPGELRAADAVIDFPSDLRSAIAAVDSVLPKTFNHSIWQGAHTL